jgi:HD-GYP domain-containing protein (c-di-GMP phosphodiesterase class II)
VTTKRPLTTDVGMFGVDEAQEEQTEQQQLAVALIMNLSALEQAGRLYELNNEAVQKVIKDLELTNRKFGQACGEGMILTAVGFSFFINRRLIRLDFNQYKRAQHLKSIWDGFGIGEMAFDQGISCEGLQEFAARLFHAMGDPNIVPSLFTRSHGGVTIRTVEGDDMPGEKRAPDEYAIRVYCALVALVRQMLAQIQAEQRPPMLRIKRALQVLVDLTAGYENLLQSLTRAPAFSRELSTHLVNTTVLTLLLGQRLNLGRPELMSLAMAALFHDLPKAGLKDSTLNSLEHPQMIPAEERPRVELHWLSTMERMVSLGGLSDEMLARLVVLYESQLEFSRADLYGTLAASEGERALPPQALFSQIITLCNLFDTLTWARQGKETVTSHRAMVALLGQAGAQFDPALAALLVQTVGLYPTGTAVLLSSGEIAVVTGQGDDPERPGVRVVVAPDGAVADGPDLDLNQNPDTRVLWPVKAGPLEINTVNCLRGRADVLY